MFEKFFYKEPSDFVNDEPELTMFCDRSVLDEHEYMVNSVITPITATVKNLDSTPGYPKFQFFDTEKEYLETCGWKEYLEVISTEETLKHRPIWWCFLKNETLKKKKIADNDIRMILCTDPVFTRIGAMFDQDQNSRMKQMTETKAAQVGWTPFFGGLDQRVRRLQKIENAQFVEMDWTRFDGTIPKALFWRIRQIRFFLLSEKYKTPQNKKFFDWYTKNLLEKIILLPTGEVCQVKRGNPSGQFSTTVDNNMVNVWLTTFEIAWLHRKQKGQLPTIQDFKKNVKFICYGDDRLLSLNKDFVVYEPEEVVQMYEKVFGMWVKPENVKVKDEIDGLSFCGMTISRTKTGQYIGIPNVNKILSTLRNPTRKLPNVEALWGKLISLRILCEHATLDVKEFLERQILAVEEFATAENIQLPEVGPDFFAKIW
ncbi:RNA-dependent RNA polymerase [Duck astrovirus]|nr:RNA-dependent RNA polymerase [Duck astrovirus]